MTRQAKSQTLHRDPGSSKPSRSFVPRKCDRENCESELIFTEARKYRRHLKWHEASKRRKLADPLRAELDNLKQYPTKCIRSDCMSEILYRDRHALRIHLRVVHRTKPEAIVLIEPKELEAELRTYTFPSKCLKPNCLVTQEFPSRAKLRMHWRMVHFIRTRPPKSRLTDPLSWSVKGFTYPAKCPRADCTSDRLYASSDTLRRHLRLHDALVSTKPTEETEPEPEEMTCSICSRSFRTIRALRHHHLLKHEKRVVNFTCEDCGAGFKRKAGLKDHRAAHHAAVTPLFLCAQCPKTFKVKRLLEAHVSRHNNEKKFFCRVCPKGYLLRYTLDEHERFAHHEELGLEPIKCQICGKTYR